VLRGDEGLAQVVEALEALEAKGHRVNATCGVHVHIGWKPTWDVPALARLVTIVAHLEKGLYAITGTNRRGNLSAIHAGALFSALPCGGPKIPDTQNKLCSKRRLFPRPSAVGFLRKYLAVSPGHSDSPKPVGLRHTHAHSRTP